MSKLSIILLLMAVVAASCKHVRLGYSKAGVLGSPGNYNGEPLPGAKWFRQKLDHFSQTDLRFWKQKYYVNYGLTYDMPPPKFVFLMIGGEGPVDPSWIITGAWIEYARNFGAPCYVLEHRYYGNSLPTKDLSVKNLSYLSSKQALADTANFIAHMNEVHVLYEMKWIVFGGSYSGSLAAWMRLKYPHLVYGAVSSSGPLQAKVDFDRYFGLVVEALKEKTGNDDCANQVIEAHRQIQSMIWNSPDVVQKEFKVCTPLSNASGNDIKNFYTSIADDFASVVQYNELNRISDNNNNNDITINSICDIITKPSSEPAFKKLGKFNTMVLDETNQTCRDYDYENMIEDLKKTSWSASGGARQWMYQTCTEFGFFQTSSAAVKFFGNTFPVDFFIQQCKEVFGAKFNKKFVYDAVRWTNTYYGGLDIAVGRVIFVHGSIDPWHALGITDAEKVKENDVKVIFINGTAHCANMYPTRDSDVPQLVEAHLAIIDTLYSWAQLDGSYERF